jgi:hypothetical protein
VSVLAGSLTLHSGERAETADSVPRIVTRGQTILLPAAVAAVELESSSGAVLLDIYLPE